MAVEGRNEVARFEKRKRMTASVCLPVHAGIHTISGVSFVWRDHALATGVCVDGVGVRASSRWVAAGAESDQGTKPTEASASI
jgi:hypothetical protein